MGHPLSQHGTHLAADLHAGAQLDPGITCATEERMKEVPMTWEFLEGVVYFTDRLGNTWRLKPTGSNEEPFEIKLQRRQWEPIDLTKYVWDLGCSLNRAVAEQLRDQEYAEGNRLHLAEVNEEKKQ